MINESKLPKPLAELKALIDRGRAEPDPLRKAMVNSKAVMGPTEDAALSFILDKAKFLGITKLSIGKSEIVSVDFDYQNTPFVLWDLAKDLGIASSLTASVLHAGIDGYSCITDRLVGNWDTNTKEYLGEPDSFWY